MPELTLFSKILLLIASVAVALLAVGAANLPKNGPLGRGRK